MPDLIVETGAGIRLADAYISRDNADTYWTNRPHDALAATWSAAGTTLRDGAIREASAYMDATWGPYYRGIVAGNIQGLLWPRVKAFDDNGLPIEGLPAVFPTVCAELSVRAISARLRPDLDRGNEIKMKREKLGPLEKTTEFVDGATVEKSYGYVAGLLEPFLNGMQPGAPAEWNWR